MSTQTPKCGSIRYSGQRMVAHCSDLPNIRNKGVFGAIRLFFLDGIGGAASFVTQGPPAPLSVVFMLTEVVPVNWTLS